MIVPFVQQHLDLLIQRENYRLDNVFDQPASLVRVLKVYLGNQSSESM